MRRAPCHGKSFSSHYRPAYAALEVIGETFRAEVPIRSRHHRLAPHAMLRYRRGRLAPMIHARITLDERLAAEPRRMSLLGVIAVVAARTSRLLMALELRYLPSPRRETSREGLPDLHDVDRSMFRSRRDTALGVL